MQPNFEMNHPRNTTLDNKLNDIYFQLTADLNKHRRYYPKTVDYIEASLPFYQKDLKRAVNLSDLHDDDEIRLAVRVLEDLREDGDSLLDLMVESDLADSLCFSLVHKQYGRLEADFIRICLEHAKDDLDEIFELVNKIYLLPNSDY